MKIILKQKYYIISCIVILLSIILNIINIGFESLSQLNVYDVFLQCVVVLGMFSSIAAIIASIVPTFSEKKIIEKNKDVNNSFLCSFSDKYSVKALKVGATFIIANFISLFLCYILSSKTAIYTGIGYGSLGNFGSVRINRPLLYIAIYNINCFLFGFCMSVFSQCLYDFVKRKHTVIVVCFLYFYSSMFLPFELSNSNYFRYIAYIFPKYIYGFITYNISASRRILGFLVMLLLSLLISWTKKCIDRKCKSELESIDYS